MVRVRVGVRVRVLLGLGLGLGLRLLLLGVGTASLLVPPEGAQVLQAHPLVAQAPVGVAAEELLHLGQPHLQPYVRLGCNPM